MFGVYTCKLEERNGRLTLYVPGKDVQGFPPKVTRANVQHLLMDAGWECIQATPIKGGKNATAYSYRYVGAINVGNGHQMGA